ncbi:MAG: hypothetical protein AAF587_45010, partial [Bacteroidota bacterium]
LIAAGETVLYGDGQLGFLVDIADKIYISKEEKKACGITRIGKGEDRVCLVREVNTRHGVANPNQQKYSLLPRGLPKAFLQLLAIGFLWRKSRTLLLCLI